MGLTRDTLEGSPEMSVETRGTVTLVRKAEPDSQALPAEIAMGGVFGWRCGLPEAFLGAVGSDSVPELFPVIPVPAYLTGPNNFL